MTRRTDLPTRPTVFFRHDGSFYVIETYEDEGFSELAGHAALNPGTVRIEDLNGSILWRLAMSDQSKGPGYDAGSVMWHSSEEEGGPDVGIQLGLGAGFSLYFGEMPTETLEAREVDLTRYPGGWWAVLCGPTDTQIIGAIPDHYVAIDAMENIAGRLRASSAEPVAPQPGDEPDPSPSPLVGQLLEALRPFAALGEEIDKQERDDILWLASPTVGDIRQARAAIQAAEEQS